MSRFYRPSESELMAEARRALRRRVAAVGGAPPAGCAKPRYGTPADAAAHGAGRITAEKEAGDRAAREERRQRSLQTCHRYALHERPRRRAPAERGTYVPELAARVEDDRNLTDGARRCARKLAEIVYRQNREERFTEITVSYLMNALHRSRRTVQRYRLYEPEVLTL